MESERARKEEEAKEVSVAVRRLRVLTRHQAETPRVHRLLPVCRIFGAVDGSNARKSGVAFKWFTI